MRIIQGFLLVITAMLLIFIMFYTLRRIKTRGAAFLAMISLAALFWSACSFNEIYATSVNSKLIWRDISLISVYSIPILTVYFAVDYTQYDSCRKYVNLISIIPAASFIFMITDNLHHLAIENIGIVSSATFGDTLYIRVTFTGMLIQIINFCLPLISIVMLVTYTRKISKEYRKNIYIIILAFILTYALISLKSLLLDMLDIYINISVLFIPGIVILFILFFRHDFLNIAPIARDKVFEIIDYGILAFDNRHVIIEANPYAENIVRQYTNFTKPLAGASLSEFFTVSPEFMKKHELAQEFSDELICENKNGKKYYSLHYYPLIRYGKNHVGYVIILHDITRQKAHENYLIDRAERDELTGLFNRAGLFGAYKLNKALFYADKLEISVFMIDLDDFKKLNDKHGHIFGDRILCDFAGVLECTLRSDDIICRFGGEEFIVILPYAGKDDAFNIAERIRKKTEVREVINDEGVAVKYTVSIGITFNADPEKPLSDMIAEADEAMYIAKDKNKNKTCIFEKNDGQTELFPGKDIPS